MPIKRDKIAPNKNIRGNMARRNLELSSGAKDEKADGDTTAVKNIIDPIRAEQRNISIRQLQMPYMCFLYKYSRPGNIDFGGQKYSVCFKNSSINFLTLHFVVLRYD